MNPTPPTGSPAGDFDPEQHDNQVVALFENRRVAEGARDALLNAGLPHTAIEVVDHTGPATTPDQITPESTTAEAGRAGEGGGFWSSIMTLFAPADDAERLTDAIGRGQAMVMVHPADPAERETAIEVLEGRGPIDIDGRSNPQPAETDLHASPPQRATPPQETTYTYGVPKQAARALSAEEQVAAQAPEVLREHEPAERQRQFVRIVEERLRVGWREPTPEGKRVRSYVAARSPRQRVEMVEEEIGRKPDQS